MLFSFFCAILREDCVSRFESERCARESALARKGQKHLTSTLEGGKFEAAVGGSATQPSSNARGAHFEASFHEAALGSFFFVSTTEF